MTAKKRTEPEETSMVTPESKRDDVELLVGEYESDHTFVFPDTNAGYTEIIASVEFYDMFKEHEYEECLRFLTDMTKRTDVARISVQVTVDFEVK